MPNTMKSLFFYYKVPIEQHALLRPLAEKFQQQVQRDWPALRCELLQRPQATPEGIETWMEVYHHPQGLSEDMMLGIERLAQEMGLPAKRASEVFTSLN
ncbi:DUF4936 family protein [Limnohabitans sp. Rim8]|uniref:DUF4936 family protein n=1 Tax=Limnohabitans sp. Rim8 TaxID=1100718 RepID=UPI0025F34A68|nr:DUF4936 family protein [Limnohabitans sp. Rim8]